MEPPNQLSKSKTQIEFARLSENFLGMIDSSVCKEQTHVRDFFVPLKFFT